MLTTKDIKITDWNKEVKMDKKIRKIHVAFTEQDAIKETFEEYKKANYPLFGSWDDARLNIMNFIFWLYRHKNFKICSTISINEQKFPEKE